MIEITFQYTWTIPNDRIENMIVSALEGGSNYWIVEEGYFIDVIRPYGEKGNNMEYFEAPLNGGSIEFKHKKHPTLVLNEASIRKGLELMATSKYKWHWMDFFHDNDDGDTADVFLQFCLLGDIIYG